jgi:membrane protease YdiL (CAAX protease family)
LERISCENTFNVRVNMKKKWIDQVKALTDKELIMQLYFTQLFLLMISIVLALFLFKGNSFWMLINWADSKILSIGLTAGIAVVFIDLLFMKWLPKDYYDDGGINNRIFGNQGFIQIVIIALLVAFSEEMLFRGVIQTKAGLLWASSIFAIIHYRYLFNWFLFLNVVLLSFLMGMIYDLTNNLAVTIVMHFIIDLLLGFQIRWEKSKKEQEGNSNE